MHAYLKKGVSSAADGEHQGILSFRGDAWTVSWPEEAALGATGLHHYCVQQVNVKEWVSVVKKYVQVCATV